MMSISSRCATLVSSGVRQLSTKPFRRGNNSRFGAAQQETVELPQFAVLLRQFYKQSHPDLLRASNAEHAAVNDESWQTLNGILSTIKERDTFPPMMNKTMPFYLRCAKSSNGVRQVDLRIRTAGGACKNQLTVTMGNFFVESGISPDGKFTWGKEYFPVAAMGEKVDEEL